MSPVSGDIRPEKMIWIFGTARVRSTWLSLMMGESKNRKVWHEPLVGKLFGHYFHYCGLRWNEWNAMCHQDGYEDFILSRSHKQTWLKSIRSFVLDGANSRFPQMAHNEYLVIQELNGSIGAPWLMEALPESRMIFLVRDPRDVVASHLDGSRQGGCLYNEEYLIGLEGSWQQKAPDSQADTNPDAFVEEVSERYLRDVGNVKQAYDYHKGHKVLVRYEDLRVNTLGTLNRIYSALEIAVDEDELAQVVDKNAFEKIPEERKGKGKVLRKAAPGGWREDLTSEQVKMVEGVTASLLEQFYSEKSNTYTPG